VKGTGAGSFVVTNLKYRGSSLDQTIEPHNVPLQFLTETGVIGLVLLAGSIGWLVVRGRRRPGPQLALALALPAYFLHSLLDVDWDFASVSAPVFLIAGALVVRPSTRPRPRAFTVLTASGVLLAVGFSLVAVWLGAHWSAQASAAVGVDDGHAIALAKRARQLNPLSLDPIYQAAAAEVDRGAAIKHAHRKGWRARYKAVNEQAYGYYTKATEVQPSSADAWFQLGVFQLGTRKCERAAYAAFNRATTLDPKNPLYNQYYASTLARVNSGKPRC
jgi:hypothetical protein